MRYHWSWLGFTVKTTNVLQVSPPFFRGWQKNRSKRPYQRPPPPRHTVESVPKLENLQDPKCSTKASETGTVVPVDSGVNIFGRGLIPPTKKKGSMYIYIDIFIYVYTCVYLYIHFSQLSIQKPCKLMLSTNLRRLGSQPSTVSRCSFAISFNNCE